MCATETEIETLISSHDDYFLATSKTNETNSIDFIAISVQMFLNATNQNNLFIFNVKIGISTHANSK